VLEAEHADPVWDPLLANDRPPGRKMILVVDDHVPQPDRDAGSRSTWCILRALTRMGLVVKFWPQDQVHDPKYTAALQQEGIEVLVDEEIAGNFGAWLKANAQRLEYALLSRPVVAIDFLQELRRSSHARVLFYGHDLHYARLMQEHALTGSRTARREAETFRKLEHSLWRQVDAVYYPSSEETQAVRAEVPSVKALTMPLYFFEDAPQVPGPQGREGIVFVGAFDRPPNVDAAKWLVHSIMPKVHAALGREVLLSLVGSNPNEEVQGLAGAHVQVTGFVDDARLLAYYSHAKVAVVPLRMGAGMKGKVIEALHYGIPLITTSVGAQGLDGLETVTTVSDDEAVLARQICAQLEDEALWTATSKRQQGYTRGRFSIEAMQHALQEGFDTPVREPVAGSHA
jgi:glycosyltransferase involved in cell wall biosynthesis